MRTGTARRHVRSAFDSCRVAGGANCVSDGPKTGHGQSQQGSPLFDRLVGGPSTAIGNERPSSFAVLRLMVSSTFVDWETGSSAGLNVRKAGPVAEQAARHA